MEYLISSIDRKDFDDFIEWDIQITPFQSISLDEQINVLITDIDHPYYQYFQYTIKSTDFIPNKVIIDLFNREEDDQQLIKETIQFGSFRSEHRLQWWNLLTILQLNSLSLNEQHVLF